MAVNTTPVSSRIKQLVLAWALLLLPGIVGAHHSRAEYIEPVEITGTLVDPGADLAAAVRRSFGLVDRPGRAHAARRMVEERYSIESMATQLSDLYCPMAVPA